MRRGHHGIEDVAEQGARVSHLASLCRSPGEIRRAGLPSPQGRAVRGKQLRSQQALRRLEFVAVTECWDSEMQMRGATFSYPPLEGSRRAKLVSGSARVAPTGRANARPMINSAR